MHEIADLIRQNVPDHVIVKTKRSKTDAESPIYYILGGVTALGAITVGRVRGAHVDDIFEFAISAAAALYLLTYRPMTKYNAGWKRFEILLVLFLMVVVVSMLVRVLVLGG